ncbi:hypothetical protein IV203_032195 [Nitzschia inconspicua]|uniref:Uncharacterized protein n=1 Tax=Nitzschia inconspicua TaxID=303405 RepID=A0A9K3P758_9STRA|nr:hypothetical protein IV203_033496 [Nitzschia inconspicua]KAG7337048.1 hypothetical protein IV203_022812 [Nitzschia inconspicua]KAG7344664.1 hypothetical protein IV203_032195 [Nitzschia inconspicua]
MYCRKGSSIEVGGRWQVAEPQPHYTTTVRKSVQKMSTTETTVATGPTCTVTCKCHKVTVTFASERPKKCVECCCCDCKAAVEWCLHQQQKGIDPPVAMTAIVQKPVSLLFVDNDILKIETRRDDNSSSSNGSISSSSNGIFELMKLRPGAGSLRILSKCCQSIMMVLHPLYLRNRIALMPDAVGKITYKDQTNNPIPVSLRMQTKFWNVDTMGELPELPRMDQVHSINTETKELDRIPVPTTASDQPTWFFTSGMVPFMMYPLPTRQGFTARTLIDVYVNKKDDVRILNILEPTIPGYFQTNKGGTLSFTFKNPFYKGDDGDTPKETKTNAETLEY